MLVKVFYLIFMISVCGFSQNLRFVSGKIVSEATAVEGILIKNSTSNEETYSQRGGYFRIQGKPNDTLTFSAFNFKPTTHVISERDFGENLVFISMLLHRTQLKELAIIDYKSINAESLGIVPKGQRTYTPAERKLMAAGEFKWYSPLLIPLGGMSVDGLINSISGRTSMLKKEVEVEKKERLQTKLAAKFDKEYVQNTLEIPEAYVEGFMFYAAEHEGFAAAMKVKNYSMASFILSELAAKYRELQGFK
ncbi:MAG: hypothetical protein KA486_02605 [Flavobacterium sp.]|nr:hypothetical protein [Flavobacterium sp.]